MILELFKNKSYFLLLLAAITFLILSFTVDKKETLDINVHDTYYVITFQHTFVLLFGVFVTIGLFYLMFDCFKVNLSLVLSRVHIYSTLFLLFILSNYLWKIKVQNAPDRYYTITNYPQDNSFAILIVLFIIILIQLLFIINIFVSLIKK
jgi:heme/copper-type cytochrome/quinol oxidase subunit 1